MKNLFSTNVNSLKKLVNLFDEESVLKQTTILTALQALKLQGGKPLLHYYDLLIFICAYPANRQTKTLAEKELKRITAFARKNKNKKDILIENEGLPFANIITRFSPDFLGWLLQHKDVKVEFDSFYNPTLSLNSIKSTNNCRFKK